jgi:DNA (cytosine-5)-methyltransferase 1
MAVRKLRFIDLFAGAGLFGHAFTMEGCELVCAVELDRTAARTHQANTASPVLVGDIRRIHAPARCDIIIAGPPCQGFSTLNRRRGDDPRNKLGLEVVRWTEACRPQIVVIENVTPFLTSPVWRQLADGLEELGYRVATTLLDAADFGVAQHRRRSFTFAFKRKQPSIPLAERRHRTVRDAWRGLSTLPDGNNLHVARQPSPLALARMKLIPPGGDKRDVLRAAPHLSPPSWRRTSCEVTDVWGRLEWDAPANTLRTCLLNASKGRYIHPEQHRVISLREAARLHSIPDSWRFEGTPYQVARQIGNSVPLLLGRAVARAVTDAAA